MVIVFFMITFIVLRHHKYHEVKKIRDRFNILFLAFRPPITCSLYFPAFMFKMAILLACLITINNTEANMYS